MEELLFELNSGELFSVIMQQRRALIERGRDRAGLESKPHL